jgi:hypothetical protein
MICSTRFEYSRCLTLNSERVDRIARKHCGVTFYPPSFIIPININIPTLGRKGEIIMSEVTDAALKFTFPIAPEVSFVTIVTGTARNNATIQIAGCDVIFWMGQLAQVTPVIKLPIDITACEGVVVKQGSTFTLQIPTAYQMGAVLFDGTITSGPTNPPTPLKATIATWSLDGEA